jgi:hypothetical protein
MRDEMSMVNTNRLRVLESRIRLYRRLLVGLSVILIAGISLAAQTALPTSSVVRAKRIEVVDEDGQAVLTAGARQEGGMLRVWTRDGKLGVGVEATHSGGRVTVLNQAGREIFSAGIRPETDIPGLWERQLALFKQQRQELDRQRRAIDSILPQLRTFEARDHKQGELERLQREIERQNRDLEWQRRELDRQRRHIDILDRQLRDVQRR